MPGTRQTYIITPAAAEGRGAADGTQSRSRPNLYGPTQRIAEYRRLGQHAVADAIARHHGLPTAAGAT
nr:hypothetical protein [uncultured Roseococcus sp.]